MKNWNEKAKKIALIAALIMVGAGTLCGIRFTLKTDESVEAAIETPVAAEEDVDLVVNTECEEPTMQEDTEELAISATPIDSVKTADTNDTDQSIQNDPVRTEDSKPSEPPTEVTEIEQDSSGEEPENVEISADTQGTSSNSASAGTAGSAQNGEVRDGKIYIEGFGWLDYDGGGTSGTQGNDIYENGNTIGIMD